MPAEEVMSECSNALFDNDMLNIFGVHQEFCVFLTGLLAVAEITGPGIQGFLVNMIAPGASPSFNIECAIVSDKFPGNLITAFAGIGKICFQTSLSEIEVLFQGEIVCITAQFTENHQSGGSALGIMGTGAFP